MKCNILGPDNWRKLASERLIQNMTHLKPPALDIDTIS